MIPVKIKKSIVREKKLMSSYNKITQWFLQGIVKKVRLIHENMFTLCSCFPGSKTAMQFSNRFSKHQLTLEPPEKNESLGLSPPHTHPKNMEGLVEWFYECWLFTALSPDPAYFCLQKSSCME